MRRIVLALTLALSLGGCGHLGDTLKLATSSIDNPISGVDIYRVKNTYAAVLEVAVEYRRYCWSAPYAVLMADPVARPVCQRRRAVVRAFQRADIVANAAIGKAESFVAKYPTINASIVIGEAWDAVTAFRASVPARGAT